MVSTLLLYLVYGSYNMTQLYSNLVTYMNNTTYLCLVLAVLCSPVVSKVRLALLHTAPCHVMSGVSYVSHVQLSKHSPFIDHRRQRRTNTWSQNKESVLLDRSRNFLFYHLW